MTVSAPDNADISLLPTHPRESLHKNERNLNELHIFVCAGRNLFDGTWQPSTHTTSQGAK